MRSGSVWHPLQNAFIIVIVTCLLVFWGETPPWIFGCGSCFRPVDKIHPPTCTETTLASPPFYWLQLIKRLSLIFVPEETRAGFSVSLQLLSAPPAPACPSVPPKPSLMQLSGRRINPPLLVSLHPSTLLQHPMIRMFWFRQNPSFWVLGRGRTQPIKAGCRSRFLRGGRCGVGGIPAPWGKSHGCVG